MEDRPRISVVPFGRSEQRNASRKMALPLIGLDSMQILGSRSRKRQEKLRLCVSLAIRYDAMDETELFVGVTLIRRPNNFPKQLRK